MRAVGTADCRRSRKDAWTVPETVRVAAGAGDNAAAAVGTGTVGDGKCNISLGTSRNDLYFQLKSSVWIATMPFMPLPMRTAIII